MLQRLKKCLLSVPRHPAGFTREAIAHSYIHGNGIEIGALHNPLQVPAGVRVCYVDRFATAELKRHYPEMADKNLVEPDIVDDGEKLAGIADFSVDFVIANHFLEHCQNPILALENMVRVLGRGGVIFLAVPDKRTTFDRNRPTTPLEHVIRDYEEGPEWSRRMAYEEWARLVDGLDPETAERQIAHYMDIQYSIHFHAWDQAAFLGLLLHVRERFQQGMDIELFLQREDEFVVILRKAK